MVPGMGDGLGGVPRSAQRSNHAKFSEMVVKSTKESSARSDSSEKDSVDLRNGKNME